MIDVSNIKNDRDFNKTCFYKSWGEYGHGDGYLCIPQNKYPYIINMESQNIYNAFKYIKYGDGYGDGHSHVICYGDGSFDGFGIIRYGNKKGDGKGK